MHRGGMVIPGPERHNAASRSCPQTPATAPKPRLHSRTASLSGAFPRPGEDWPPREHGEAR